ncbi:MAG: hypothetical protein ACLQDL_16730 [Spirochaetia bacterium]
MSPRAHACSLLLSACIAIPRVLHAQPGELRIEEGYQWPGRAILRVSVTPGDLLIAKTGPGAPVFGMSLPWLRCGPLMVRGMVKQAFDPLSFSAWSGVFEERTGLALDSALESPGAGVLLMPVPEQCGVYCRNGREGGTELGVFGALPLGPGAAAECVCLSSRPDPQPASDEWFVSRCPFPGGTLTQIAARLKLDSPSLACSCAAGVSSAQLAAPGAFSLLWLRGRLPQVEGAVLLSGATPGYRAPDGASPGLASRSSAMLRFGPDHHRGIVEVGLSFAAAEPAFSPRREIPTHTTLRAAFSRDVELASARSLSLLVEAQKEVIRDCDGVREDTSRCGSTACISLGSVDLVSGVDCADHEGIRVRGGITARPSPRLRIGVEATGSLWGTAHPTASARAKLSVEGGDRRAVLQAGVEDCPLGSPVTGQAGELARHFRLSLSYSLRCP